MLYSRPLSPAARAKLIDAIDQILRTLGTSEVDYSADLAKQAVIELLRDTDIDIVVFMCAIM